jgi:ABC-2 type transport system ATP-binding protein
MNAKKGLAFVPEVPSLYELLTVYEHLRFVAMCFDNLPKFDEQHEALLRKYHLWDKRDNLVATLSKGMRQKLSVACAMIHDANVFLFDEPLIGIDPAGAHELKQELVDARNRGGSILISTHLLDTAEKLCDRVMIMARGKLLAEGTPEELRRLYNMEDKSLEELFLSLTGDVE